MSFKAERTILESIGPRFLRWTGLGLLSKIALF
jgi:hypothetical protein